VDSGIMTQNFLRHSPDVERANPNSEQTLQTVVEGVRRYVEGSVEAEGIRRAVMASIRTRVRARITA
jgi:hypothetical protein